MLVCERTDRPADAAGSRLRRRHGRPALRVRPGAPRAGLQEARYLSLAGDRAPAPRQTAATAAAGGADDHRTQRDLPGQDDTDRRRSHHGWLEAERSRPPSGLDLAITGSAVVGHDMNTASNESIATRPTATIVLVVVILLVVYRSPLLALIPLVTIALSVWRLLRDRPPDEGARPGLPGHQHHERLRDRRPLRRGDGLLPVPDRALTRGAGPGPVAGDALREAIVQVGGALVARPGRSSSAWGCSGSPASPRSSTPARRSH